MSFLDNIDKYKNKVCVIEDDKSFSYSDIIFSAKKLTTIIPKRSLVFLLGGNNYETLTSYIGLIRSKSVVAVLDKDIDKKNLENLIKKYLPNFIILPKLLKKIHNYKNIKDFNRYSILKNMNNKKILINKNLAILLSTSGSTGSPKFVRLSYKNYTENSKQIIKSLNLKNHSTITSLPIHYTFGLSIINTHLISGGKIILNNSSILEKNFWEIYKKNKPNIFYGVPYIYEMLTKLKYKDFFHNELIYFTNAGGKLKENILKEIIRQTKHHKSMFSLMYGQTEASPRMSNLNYKYNSKKLNSIGKALNGGRFELLDERNNIIKEPFTEGELIYYGNNVSLGYSKNQQDLKMGDFNKGKLFTGDLAIFDKDNYFYITGRKKRIIKIFGIRICLDEIENMIIENFKIHANCDVNDEKLIINHNSKKINQKKIIKILSSKLKINQNFIYFKFDETKEVQKIKNKSL